MANWAATETASNGAPPLPSLFAAPLRNSAIPVSFNAP